MSFYSTDSRTGWWQGTDGTTIGGTGTPTTPVGSVYTVATATRYSRLAFTVPTDTTYQATVVLGSDATGLHVVYSFPHSVSTGSLVLASALEWAGVLHPVTFNGSARTTLTPTTRWAVSDPLPGSVSKGTSIKVRTFAAAGSVVMRGGAAQNAGRTSTAGDLTVAGSGPLTISPGIAESIVAPVAIRGTTSTRIAFAGLGDSIMEGGADSDVSAGGGGFFDRAMRGAGVPSIDFGIWADNFPYDPAGDRRYGDNLDYISHALSEYGTNQVSGASAGFGVIANAAIVFWNWVAFVKGVALWQSTLVPRTTSTDDWTTLAGQTHMPNEASRVGFNDWVRDGSPILAAGTYAPTGSSAVGTVRAGQPGHPLKGYLEVADTVESARNSGLWKVNGTARWTVQDGVHPAPAGHAAMAVPVQAWAEGLV